MNVQVRGSHWVVGIDAGATQTKGVLVNFKGDELASGEASSFNLRFQKVDEFEGIVHELVRDLINKAHLGGHVPGAVAMGVAGAGRERDRNLLRDAIAGRFQQSRVLLHHDAFIAHYGAFAGRPGVLVTAGTGSIAFGRNEAGEEARAGGWGWLLGDEGSGWWIGREAVRAALASWEGSGPESVVEQLIRDSFHLDSTYDVIPLIYREKISRRDITLLAKPVADLAKQGDAVAADIYREAGRQLGRLALITSDKLEIAPRELNVSMLGSIAVGDWPLLEEGVWEVVQRYEAGGAKALEEAAMQAAARTLPSKEKGAGEPAGEAEEPAVKMPQYPPRDLTVSETPGPHLIRPEMSAVRGAAQWGIDELQRQQFA